VPVATSDPDTGYGAIVADDQILGLRLPLHGEFVLFKGFKELANNGIAATIRKHEVLSVC
jgi:hypothetical protein